MKLTKEQIQYLLDELKQDLANRGISQDNPFTKKYYDFEVKQLYNDLIYNLKLG